MAKFFLLNGENKEVDGEKSRVNTTDFIAGSGYYDFCLNQFFQFFYHGIFFFLCIVFAEREANRDQVGIIINNLYHMRTYICPAATGAAARYTDMIDIKIKKYHF